MSGTAAVAAHTTEPREREVTWREAITPVSRASRRRWTALYPLLLGGLGVVVVAPDLLGLGEDSGTPGSSSRRRR